MVSAIKGKGLIPLEAMVKFVRVAHIYEQKDVMEMIGERVIQATQESSDPLVIGRGKALQLMIAMELLVGANKRVTSAKEGTSKRGLSAGGGSVGTRGSVSLRDGSPGPVKFPVKVSVSSTGDGKGEGKGGRGGMGEGEGGRRGEGGRGGKGEGEGGRRGKGEGGKGEGKAAGKEEKRMSPKIDVSVTPPPRSARKERGLSSRGKEVKGSAGKGEEGGLTVTEGGKESPIS
jgi:hypothetical protein